MHVNGPILMVKPWFLTLVVEGHPLVLALAVNLNGDGAVVAIDARCNHIVAAKRLPKGQYCLSEATMSNLQLLEGTRLPRAAHVSKCTSFP